MKKSSIIITLISLLSLLFIGCDEQITMQDVEKAKFKAEQDKKELTDKLRSKFDSEYNHIEFCNKYGALYYVNENQYGYVLSAPVLDKDSKVIPCERN
jgi:hypothetical protein